MCTLMTFGRKFIRENEEAIKELLLTDDQFNPHGLSILTYAYDGACTSHSSTVGRFAYDYLEAIPYDRVWIHFRAATTKYIGLPYNHGYNCFNGWYIMHNGIIENPGYYVDTLAMVEDFSSKPPTHARVGAWLREPFNNTLIVHPENGEYFVLRSQHGELHTDGKGNFSSTPIGAVSIPVPRKTVELYDGQGNLMQNATVGRKPVDCMPG